ncbi:MAG: hypothetical protein M3Q64_02770 [bacterium]|nr:hypothetical protein [bacterium]
MTQEEEHTFDPAKFELEWVAVAEEVVERLLANPEIQEIKTKVRTEGHLNIEDRDKFIQLVNQIKYECIYEKYGKEDSEGYKSFVKKWQLWQKLKGTARPQGENMFEDNINHLLYGSTPDPDMFLKDFDLNQDI